MKGNVLGVLLLCGIVLLLLGFGAGKAGIAAVFSDPVSGFRAQDETTYASSALVLANQGGWLTPRVMGRFLLVKPPLLIWLAGLSIRVLGVSSLALRLPVLIAGTLATLLLILWAKKMHSPWLAVLTGFLLVANPLWHLLSRICYTDMLLAAAMSAALFILVLDPVLGQHRSVWGFAAATAAGVMAKNVAGLLPVAILVLFSLLAESGKRPGLWRIAQVCGLAALLAAPWHVYQFISHPRWFWTDYVQIQLLQFGLKPPVQPSPEGPVLFYARRLALMDPVLCVLALLAAPSLVRAIRRRQSEAILLVAWLLVSAAALLAFRYRNLPYLLYAIPPLCLAAAIYGPLSRVKSRAIIAGLMAALFCAKVAFPRQYWGLSYGEGTPLPAARTLRAYAQLGRPNELIAVSPDDEFYAAVLPLPKVRYCYIDPQGVARRYAPHYAYLGITLSVAEFDELPRWLPLFRERLREWGLDSTEPVGTTIVADSPAEVLRLVAAHRDIDFYLPADLRRAIEPLTGAGRRVLPSPPDRFFLLGSVPPGRPAARTQVTLPENW